MKKILTFALLACCTVFATQVHAQGSPNDNAEQRLKRASLGSNVIQTVNGATVNITYSAPALKGRTIGKDIEPMTGKVWRAGANEATSIEVSKDVTIEGQKLPAGKYGLYIIAENANEWTIIINKTWSTWGAFSYKQADDVIRVKAKVSKSNTYFERLVYTIDHDGKVSIIWGNTQADFRIK